MVDVRPTVERADEPPLGIIMLDTAFERPLGDAGNPHSWPFPVLIERVPGAYAQAVVCGDYRSVDAFVAAGQHLVARGACAVTTTCGFLARFQAPLQDALPVPVDTSPLLHFGRLQRALSPRGQQVAILTIDANALDGATCTAAGVPADALAFSLPPNASFVESILHGRRRLDVVKAEAEWVALARACLAKHPAIGLWLFECANMPPYRAAVSGATGLPVFDVLDLGRALHARACVR